LNEATCPNKHTVRITGTNSDGRVFSCGHCLAQKKPHVHPLPEKLIPVEYAETIDPGFALAAFGVTVVEEAAPASEPEVVKRGPGRPKGSHNQVAVPAG
jgi:hypothetical protein